MENLSFYGNSTAEKIALKNSMHIVACTNFNPFCKDHLNWPHSF